jgi:hypothetical protein
MLAEGHLFSPAAGSQPLYAAIDILRWLMSQPVYCRHFIDAFSSMPPRLFSLSHIVAIATHATSLSASFRSEDR